MKLCSIVGARPQFVKAAVVSRAWREETSDPEALVHTGQHYDQRMSELFFEEMEIPEPDYNLGIGSAPHGAQTGKMLAAIEEVLLEEEPDWVLVYGDTNSTLAGALAAVKLHIPVAHVEAGLRSFNRRMPEEINRVLTDHASDLLFAPTRSAEERLLEEGIPEERVEWVGDVMYDASLLYAEKAERGRRRREELGLKDGEYALATVHRAENTDDERRLAAVVHGLEQLHRELPVVLPLHPRTRNAMAEAGLLTRAEEAFHLIEPVGYLDMVDLERHAAVIATDSGGVQKEAFFYEVPCVTLREETEWTELVELGWNRLVPPISADEVYRRILDAIGTKGEPASPYGEGTSGQAVVRLLRDHADNNAEAG